MEETSGFVECFSPQTNGCSSTQLASYAICSLMGRRHFSLTSIAIPSQI
jgi:hypothetical protein